MQTFFVELTFASRKSTFFVGINFREYRINEYSAVPNCREFEFLWILNNLENTNYMSKFRMIFRSTGISNLHKDLMEKSEGTKKLVRSTWVFELSEFELGEFY